jgi:hypothetical protein
MLTVRQVVNLVLIIAAISGTLSYAHVLKGPHPSIRYEFTGPSKVIEIYLQAVDRGELLVFDKKIDRSVLIPRSVEYIYVIGYAKPRVKVYAELSRPLPLPGQDGYKIRAVSASLDTQGHIIKTEAHVWPDKQ